MRERSCCALPPHLSSSRHPLLPQRRARSLITVRLRKRNRMKTNATKQHPPPWPQPPDDKFTRNWRRRAWLSHTTYMRSARARGDSRMVQGTRHRIRSHPLCVCTTPAPHIHLESNKRRQWDACASTSTDTRNFPHFGDVGVRQRQGGKSRWRWGRYPKIRSFDVVFR